MTSPQRIIGLRESVYSDADWLALPAAAQWLYLVIARDPFVSAAGMGPVTLRRWSNRAADQTEESVERHLHALVDGGRAILDEHYRDYVLLPKLLLDTGIADQPNALAGAIKTAAECPSPSLREAFAAAVADFPVRSSELAVGMVEKRGRRRQIPADVRLAVYQRDKWTCQDCARIILPRGDDEAAGFRAPSDDAGWLELDHIHPHSAGGEDTVENLRALCSRCNRVKGVRRIVAEAREALG